MAHTVLILAAGVGRRLGVGDDRPKWLAPLGATTPAALQLEACAASDVVERVVVVAGHAEATVASFVEPWRSRLDIELVPNPQHRERNNWYSLQLGLEAVDLDRGAFVVNSDLCAPSAWFVQLLGELAANGRSALAVDFERPLTDEAMKVATDGQGRLVDIGKVGVESPAGEYVGLLLLDAVGATGLLEELRAFQDQADRVQAWYEHGIQEHLRHGATYRGAPVPDSGWVEVDTPEDLTEAVRVTSAVP